MATTNLLFYIKITNNQLGVIMDNKTVFIISSNKELKNCMARSGYFSDVFISNNYKHKIPNETDILIADEAAISLEQYKTIFDKNFKHIKSHYFISSDQDTYQKVYNDLSAMGIIVFPPKLTAKQITQSLCEYSIDDYIPLKSAICFFGGGHGAGVSIVSQLVAKRLSEITDKSIAYIILSGSEEADYINTNGGNQGLSAIKDKLTNNILSREELLSSFIKYDNLYILPGERDISKVKYYHPKHIENLVDLSLDAFDAIILNCGSGGTNGMSIGGINSSGLKYLVTTQSSKYLNNFKKIEKQIFSNLGIDTNEFKLILNKYIDSDQLPSAGKLSEAYNMQISGLIKLSDPVLSLIIESGGGSFLDNDKYFKKSIDLLSGQLASNLNFEILDTEKRKNLFKRFLDKNS